MFTLQLLPTPGQHSNEALKNKVFTREEKLTIETLQREILVLQEQSKQVEGFLVEATSRRRFEDAQMLKESLDELTMEIARQRQELVHLGWTDELEMGQY